VVLIDEVEALAVRRSSASFETNPVDVHRATDAVLAGLNALRARCPHVVLIVMTNFLQAVDEAVLSRADLVLTTELPNAETIEGIVHGSLEELAGQWQDIRRLAEDKALHAELASLLVGGPDGRRVRKTVLSALASRTEVAMEPGLVTADDLRCAAQFSRQYEVWSVVCPVRAPDIFAGGSCSASLMRSHASGREGGAAGPGPRR
jgi:AAA+ superfamily predicted ATPase